MHLVEGEDFTVMSPDVFEATFTSGSMIGDTACDNITIVDDRDLEGNQIFSLRISGSTPSGAQIMTAGAFTIVFIEDNEGTHWMTSVLSRTQFNYVSVANMNICYISGKQHCLKSSFLEKVVLMYTH